MTVLEEYAPYIHSKEMEEREAYYWSLYPNLGRGCIRDLLLLELIKKRNKIMIERFLIPQETDYNTALQEVKNGKKVTHWIWYIFPQMKGLGKSEKSNYYGIRNRNEASAYINHPILRKRLVEITQAVLDSQYSVPEIFGNDAIKVYSCVKLFSTVCDEPVFKKLMQKEGWH